LDYYLPIEVGEWHGVASDHADDTLKMYLHWAPVSVFFNTAVTF
jgi:hypothetical protein